MPRQKSKFFKIANDGSKVQKKQKKVVSAVKSAEEEQRVKDNLLKEVATKGAEPDEPSKFFIGLGREMFVIQESQLIRNF